MTQKKLVIARDTKKDRLFTVLLEDDRITQIRTDDESHLLGDIYIGKVKNLAPAISAAFIEIACGVPCYYDLHELSNAVFTNKQGSKPLVPGDELLVQLNKEPQRGKHPGVTTNLTLPGRFLILTSDRRIGASHRMDRKQRDHLKELLHETFAEDAPFGFILRTNCAEASDADILNEAEELAAEYTALLETARTRVCFTKLRSGLTEYKKTFQDFCRQNLTEIITDDDTVYDIMDKMSADMTDAPEPVTVTRYRSNTQPLLKAYGIDAVIADSRKRIVWLKSGANLVIDHTEALTVIDVNSGKRETGKRSEDLIRKTNLEAAERIASELRLRNISGIILVDFINMKDPGQTEMLLESFSKMLAKDPVPTSLVDMTALQLVEITRKKVHKPLFELEL